MTLQWYGTASLLLSEGNTIIAFDPFDGLLPGNRCDTDAFTAKTTAFRTAGNVFVTHGHFDHILHIPALYAAHAAVIHATRTPCRTLTAHGIPVRQLHCITPDRSYTVGPFTVHTYQGRHCTFDRPLVLRTAIRFLSPRNLRRGLRLLRLNRTFPENGEILFYEVRAGGKRVQIMGSMGLDPSVEYPSGADVLVLPFQGRSDPSHLGESLVRRLRPKAVLLDHYDDSFPPMTARIDTAAFEALIQEKYRIPCRALREGTVYRIEEMTL